jgi:hypothetical protein
MMGKEIVFDRNFAFRGGLAKGVTNSGRSQMTLCGRSHKEASLTGLQD